MLRLHRTSALLTHPPLSSRSVHPCDFHRRVPSSSWTLAAWDAVHQCSWQPRTAHVTFHLVHPLQRDKIATVVVAFLLIDNLNTPGSLKYSISSFRPPSNSFGSILGDEPPPIISRNSGHLQSGSVRQDDQTELLFADCRRYSRSGTEQGWSAVRERQKNAVKP